jgi:acyl-coenzyme A thioesterase PaaI-like protein
MEEEVSVEGINNVLQAINDGYTSSFQSSFQDCLKAVRVEKRGVVFEFTVKEEHCNRYRTLHGGCIATLIDLCTSIGASVVTKTLIQMDVSIDLQVSFLVSTSGGCTSDRNLLR